MRYKSLSNILKAVVLAISWLTLSPLLLILDGRWKLLPKWLRIVLFVVSPMMLIIIGLAVLFANAAAIEHFHKHHFAKPRVIERITDVDFPKYKFVNYKRCGGGHGPVHYDAELEFDDVPDEAFYKALEKRGDYYIDDNDSVRTFSFKKPYKYLSLDSYYDFITYGDAVIEVKEDSRTFKVTLFEWPGNNQFSYKKSK